MAKGLLSLPSLFLSLFSCFSWSLSFARGLLSAIDFRSQSSVPYLRTIESQKPAFIFGWQEGEARGGEECGMLLALLATTVTSNELYMSC